MECKVGYIKRTRIQRFRGVRTPKKKVAKMLCGHTAGQLSAESR